MNFIKKYKKKRRITNMIFKEFEKSLKEGNYTRSSILSQRLVKLKL